MAEERLIDDDKDKKYRIRRNEDGEEELVLIDSPEEEEKPEEPEFEFPELDGDDEEAAVMTPEQLAARDRARAEAEQKRLTALAEKVEFAQKLISEGKFGDCVFVVDEAMELDRGNGELYALKLIALTENLDSFARADESLAAAGGFYEFADGAVKEKYSGLGEKAREIYAPIAAEAEDLRERNEQAKEARRVSFTKKRNKAAIYFGATAIPMLIFAVLAICFSTIMYAVKDGTNMILFFVFLGVAGALFIASLFTAHKLWDASKLLSLNKKNTSSKLGREYEAKNAEFRTLQKLISAYDKPEAAPETAEETAETDGEE